MKRYTVVLLLTAVSALPLLFSGYAALSPTADVVQPPTAPPLCSVAGVHAETVSDTLFGSLLRLTSGDEQALIAYRPLPSAVAGILWLSGVDGGLDGPYEGFFTKAAERLARFGFASAQLLYAQPGELTRSAREAALAIAFLAQEGIGHVALVGFSFGGAVAIDVAADCPAVAAVATLGAQAFGTDRVTQIAPRPILIVHSAGDPVMPVSVAYDIYERAGDRKRLVVLPSEDHYLTDVGRRVHTLLTRWLVSNTTPAVAAQPVPEPSSHRN